MRREDLLNEAAALISVHYVFPDVAEVVADRLRSSIASLAAVGPDEAFVRTFNELLFEVSQDRHLELLKSTGARTVSQMLTLRSLDEGIVLVGIDRFPRLTSAYVEEIDTVMRSIAFARRVIFDLRRNSGGDGTSVSLVTSYLLPLPPILLAEYHVRPPQQPGTSWSWEILPGSDQSRPLADAAIAVLVGPETYSAAEEFAYTLKHLGRATIVGDRTRGGAHPTRYFRLDEYRLGIPFAETISPLTGTNWESVGVEPDVPCPADDALQVALRLLNG